MQLQIRLSTEPTSAAHPAFILIGMQMRARHSCQPHLARCLIALAVACLAGERCGLLGGLLLAATGTAAALLAGADTAAAVLAAAILGARSAAAAGGAVALDVAEAGALLVAVLLLLLPCSKRLLAALVHLRLLPARLRWACCCRRWRYSPRLPLLLALLLVLLPGCRCWLLAWLLLVGALASSSLVLPALHLLCHHLQSNAEAKETTESAQPLPYQQRVAVAPGRRCMLIISL